MIVIQCEQGSEAWHAARAGCITASMFKVARQRLKTGANKGEFNEASKNYAFRLAVEQISGVPLDEGFSTWQMKRGNELEPDARRRHEEEAGVVVERAGFVVSDDGEFGASADGLIGEDSGSEYKCLVSPEGLRDVLVNNDMSEFTDQVQGCMWITGRKTWHFGLYCPALLPVGADFTYRVVKRDDNYINDLEQDLIAFRTLVLQYRSKLKKLNTVANDSVMKVAA